MNLKTPIHSQRTLLLSLSLVVASAAHAGFQYNPRDVVLGFRQDGGSAELAINAGQVSTFYSLPNGTTITISNLTYSLLTNAFPDFNNLHFAASADVRTTGDATYPFETLWVLNPRDDINTQTSPWYRHSEYLQAPTASKIDGIANGAVSYGGFVPTSPVNTATGIVLPAGNTTYSYSYFIGTAGNYKGTFSGNAECATPGDFADAGLPVRADFYQLVPGAGLGVYLGFFEFNTNGVLTFTSGAAALVIPQPTITSIVRSGTTNIVSFTTVTGGQYSLRVTNGAGLTTPMGSWPVSGSAIPGDGTTKSLNDVTTAPFRLYGVSASP
jgi:hypothetical protein